nr:probable inactive histone-lysine N-methyltransferase SUVR2 [Tanacetum cinerariifolium]
IREVLLMLEILSRRFFLKLNLYDHRSILMDLQETLKRRWRYLIPAESQSHNHMLIPDYQDIKFQDFHYSDGFECYQIIKIGRRTRTTLKRLCLRHQDSIPNANGTPLKKPKLEIEALPYAIPKSQSMALAEGSTSSQQQSKDKGKQPVADADVTNESGSDTGLLLYSKVRYCFLRIAISFFSTIQAHDSH